MGNGVVRTVNDGVVTLAANGCTFTYHRPRPGIVFIRISGPDKGQFGRAPLDEMADDLARYAPIEVFVSVDERVAAAVPVQEAWTEWFSEHRSELKSVSILARSKYMHFTAEVA